MYLTKFHINYNHKNKTFLFNYINSSIIQLDKYKYVNMKKGIFNDLDKKEIIDLVNQGFLFPKNIDKEIAEKIFFESYKKALNKSDILHVSFYVTDYCNLRCNYCMLLGELNQNHMSQKTANGILKFIQKIKNVNEKLNFIQLQYTGGEPFLNKKILYHLIEKNNLIFKDIKKVNTITTNGTINLNHNDIDFINKNNIILKITFNLHHYEDINRLDINGKNKNEDILKNIKNIIDMGIKNKIQISSAYTYPKIKKEYESNEKYKNKVIEKFKEYNININKINFRLDKNIVIFDTKYGYSNENSVNRKYSNLKNWVKEVNDENQYDVKKIFKRLNQSFCCCAFKEGKILNFDTLGNIRNLIPQYNNKKFWVGNYNDNFEYIIEKIAENKKNNAKWMNDEICQKCPKLTKCFGGCVERYEAKNLKPSENCNNDFIIFLDKLRLKKILQKLGEI